MSSRHAYFFAENRYLRYDIDTDVVDVGPTEISENWGALPEEFQRGVDAVINWGNGKAYFFRLNRYLRYDMATDVVDVGPTEISRNWATLPSDFQQRIDAAINWGDGFAYFFRGDKYVRYDIDADKVDVGPTTTSINWPALPVDFARDIDAAVNWGDGYSYFFKNHRYVRYDMGSDVVDVGPAEISDNWTALPSEFDAGIDDIVNWGTNLTLHWERNPMAVRQVEIVERLVDFYGYPVNGAAGLVGNLVAESGLVPPRIEGSAEATPLRAQDFSNHSVTFSPEDVMNRSQSRNLGPKLPGVGLAQWTSAARRAGLFTFPYHGSGLGYRVLYNLDAQLGYLVHELQTNFPGVHRVLTNASVAANAASDEVVYSFEVPGSILSGGTKLPRSDSRVQAVFAERRRPTQDALRAFTAAHP